MSMVHRAISKLMTNDQRKKLILDVIRKKDDHNKEDVIRGLSGKVSRVTILRLIKELEESGIIEVKQEKENSRDYKLSVVEGNPLITIPKQMINFKEAYLDLLDSVIETLKDKKSEERVRNMKILDKGETHGVFPATTHDELLLNTLTFFKVMVDTCSYKMAMEWSTIFRDKKKLREIYVTTFESIAAIYEQLILKLKSSGIIRNESTAKNFWGKLYNWTMSEDGQVEFFRPFEQYHLFQKVQKLYETEAIRNMLITN